MHARSWRYYETILKKFSKQFHSLVTQSNKKDLRAFLIKKLKRLHGKDFLEIA